jgi:hypothetical protein
MPVTYTIARRDQRSLTATGGSVTFTVSVGPRGPNLITDATALGTLSDTTTPAFLLVGAAAGDRARKLTPTPWGLSNLLASVPAGRVPYSDAGGLVTSNAGLTYTPLAGITANIGTFTEANLPRIFGGASGMSLEDYTTGGIRLLSATGGIRLNSPTTVTGNLTVRQPGGTAGSHESTHVHGGSAYTITNVNAGGLSHLRLALAGGEYAEVTRSSGFTVAPIGTARYLLQDSQMRLASGVNVGWSGFSVPTSGFNDVGFNRFDTNTIEVNNGTRTASGGAFRDFVSRTLYATTTGTGTGNEFIIIGGTTNKTIGSYSNLLGYSYQLVGDSNGNGGPMNFRIGALGTITWRSTNRSDSGSDDTRLRRSSANVLDLDTGVDGAFGDLRLRNITMSGRLAFATSDAAPANTTTPLLWVNVLVGGLTYKMPLYQ